MGISVIVLVGLVVIFWTATILVGRYLEIIKAKAAFKRTELSRSLTRKQKTTFKLLQILYSKKEKVSGLLTGLRSVKAEEKGDDTQYQPLEKEYTQRLEEIENDIKNVGENLDAIIFKNQNEKDIYGQEMESIELMMVSKVIGEEEASKRKRDARQKTKRLESDLEKARFVRNGDSSEYYGGYKDVPLNYTPRPIKLCIYSSLESLNFIKGRLILGTAAILMLIGFLGLGGFHHSINVIRNPSAILSTMVMMYPALNGLSDFELYYSIFSVFYPLLSGICIILLLILLRKRISISRSLLGLVFFFYPLCIIAYLGTRILLSSSSLIEISPGELKLLDPELNINLLLYIVGVSLLILCTIAHIVIHLFEAKPSFIQKFFPIFTCLFTLLIFMLPYEGYSHSSMSKAIIWKDASLSSAGALESWINQHGVVFGILMLNCVCIIILHLIELFKPSVPIVTKFIKLLLLVIFGGLVFYLALRTANVAVAILILGWMALIVGSWVDIIETKPGAIA